MSMGIFRHLPCNVYQSLHAWTVLVRWYTKTDTKQTSNPLHSQILEGNLEEQKGLSISRLIDTPWKNTNSLLNIQYTDFNTLGNSLTPIMLSKLLLTNPNRRINLQFCILISHLKVKNRMRGCVCSCCYILPYEVDSANHKPEKTKTQKRSKNEEPKLIEGMTRKLTVLRLLTFSSRDVETPWPCWSASASAPQSRGYSTLLILERHFADFFNCLPSPSAISASLLIKGPLSWLFSEYINLRKHGNCKYKIALTTT